MRIQGAKRVVNVLEKVIGRQASIFSHSRKGYMNLNEI